MFFNWSFFSYYTVGIYCIIIGCKISSINTSYSYGCSALLTQRMYFYTPKFPYGYTHFQVLYGCNKPIKSWVLYVIFYTLNVCFLHLQFFIINLDWGIYCIIIRCKIWTIIHHVNMVVVFSTHRIILDSKVSIWLYSRFFKCFMDVLFM